LLADSCSPSTEVESGATEEMVINVPAGTHQIICAIDTHFDAGMEGTKRRECAARSARSNTATPDCPRAPPVQLGG